jgi:hypothetical protein
MNYAQLVQAVQDYTENDEATFVSQIPRFVNRPRSDWLVPS